MLDGKKILLIISGGIAAVKSPLLVSQLTQQGVDVTCILTEGGAQFTTDMALAALSKNKVHTNLWDADGEAEIGHIQLSRQADLVVVAPASANTLAKIANGYGDDLASTALLATDKPVMVFPAMNPEMYHNPAVQKNLEILINFDHVKVMQPAEGLMACGETGLGRMPEVDDIILAITNYFEENAPLKGLHAIVTSGPTKERIDPVRYITNDSSGKQGHAIAAALYNAGANVTLVTGDVALPDPKGVKTVHIESAKDMLAACEAALPADIAVCAAAVADFGIDNVGAQKFKKGGDQQFPELHFSENPDILATLSQHETQRPQMVVGFAAETENLIDNAQAKLNKKACDMIVANNVGDNQIFGGDENIVTFVTNTGTEELPKASKEDVAQRIIDKIIERISNESLQRAPKIANDFSPAPKTG